MLRWLSKKYAPPLLQSTARTRFFVCLTFSLICSHLTLACESSSWTPQSAIPENDSNSENLKDASKVSLETNPAAGQNRNPTEFESDRSKSAPSKQTHEQGQKKSDLRANGEHCMSNSQCESAICEGFGCDDEQPGTCMALDRMCSYDIVQYCGCNGKTFDGSGNCPGHRYASRGRCPGDPGTDDHSISKK